VDSKRVLESFTGTVRKTLKNDSTVSISGIGTLTVISVPSRSESLGADKFAVHPPTRNIFLESNPSATAEESFVTELASTLGLSQEDSQTVITLLIQEMIDQMPVTINGLGTFSKSHEGFSFSADDQLIKFIFDRSLDLTPVEVKKEVSALTSSKKSSISRRRTAWPIIAIPIALILVIGGYFLIPRIVDLTSERLQNSESSDIATDTTAVPPTETEEEGLSESNPLLIDPPDITSSDTDVSVAIPAPSAQVPTLNRLLGGYTLIIASFNSSSQALTVVEKFRRIYPNMPVDTLISTNNRYRVTIGQVPTIPEAITLKESLNEIPSDSWVMNILNRNF